MKVLNISRLILAIQTASSITACKFNARSTDVFLLFRPLAENPDHRLSRWSLTPAGLR